jgi:hypothetical protein
VLYYSYREGAIVLSDTEDFRESGYEQYPSLLPPSDDGVFKTLLTHPDAERVRVSVLSAFTGLKIARAEVRNIKQPISDILEKQEQFDVNCLAEEVPDESSGEA